MLSEARSTLVRRGLPRAIAGFDSASAMIRANAYYLRGKDFPGVGFLPPSLEPLGDLVNRLPQTIKEAIYSWSGYSEAISVEELSQVDFEDVARWVVSEYPQRGYPAVMIGSSNGAAIHLNAAMGIPWLPQTFLVPVRQPEVHPDDTIAGMNAGREAADRLLEANPTIQLHHMQDASQDRLMLEHIGYFRVKKLRLGSWYEQFLRSCLPPGGTIIINECQRTWPSTQLGDRYYFQHGGLGGVTEDEFHQGSLRVEEFLERYGSHKRRWDSPRRDVDAPEAEWGFEPALYYDIERIAHERGYKIRRIAYDEPEHLSPLVADLYRWWYRQRQLRPNRLLIESFNLLEPYWALRTGSAPFWMKFNMEPSLEWVEHYLQHTKPYDQIHLMLFSHGVEGVGLPSIDKWRHVLRHARKEGGFAGVDQTSFPRDFASLVRYQTDLKKIPARYPLPGMLTMNQLDQFLREFGDRYRVEVRDDSAQSISRGSAQARPVH